MAGKGSNTTNSANRIVCCMDCFWANLMQYEHNPVLAECRMRPNTGDSRFPYSVEVAKAQRICKMHQPQDGEKFIQPRVHDHLRNLKPQQEKGAAA